MRNPLPDEVYSKRKTYRETDIRGDYFRDQTAIIHSTPFRRLKKKTQVFFAPENDHICTRIEHVLHVATIASTICKGLNKVGWELNDEMAYAIGLGHDLGHTPFGHAGEKSLDIILSNSGHGHFVHEVNSYRQVAYLANHGNGLNLCYGVMDGIICHNGERDEQYAYPNKTVNDLDAIKDRSVMPSSYEGCIMRFSDKIAYLGRDLEDAFVAGFITEDDVPDDVKEMLGNHNGQIINSLILDLIENSKNRDMIGFSDDTYEVVTKLKKFNYEKIYSNKILNEYDRFCHKIINNLFDYLHDIYAKNQKDYGKYAESSIELDRYFGQYINTMDH
ncbi:MAG: HD domain-containing protein, partial [Bacteroidales bacterium]|nr:HD domain-containing protein [Bacteroidales bacterium]